MTTTETEGEYVKTLIELYAGPTGRIPMAIPRDATILEVACFAAFLTEYGMRLRFTVFWDALERIEHYGLQRFVIEGDKP